MRDQDIETEIKAALKDPEIKTFADLAKRLDREGGSTSYYYCITKKGPKRNSSPQEVALFEIGDISLLVEMVWESR